MKVIRLILLLLLLACEERFEFRTDGDNQTSITIQGFINQSTDPYYVYISQTQRSGAPTPVVGATVELKDEANNVSVFKETDRGVYMNDLQEIVGQPGSAYFVEVTLLSGDKYRSDPDTIPTITAVHNMSWDEYSKSFSSDLGIDFNLPVVSVDLNVTLPQTEQPVFLHWLGEEVFQFVPTDFPDPFGSIPPPCYVKQPFGTERVNIFSNVGYQSADLKIDEIFWREIDASFVRKHIFSIYQYSISERYYTYLKGVESLVENSGSLFDTPPGQVIGNFKAVEGTNVDPLGYFAAYLSDTMRIAIYPNELTTFIYEECFYRGGFGRDYSPQCNNCLLVPRSSYNRPYYWVKY